VDQRKRIPITTTGALHAQHLKLQQHPWSKDSRARKFNGNEYMSTYMTCQDKKTQTQKMAQFAGEKPLSWPTETQKSCHMQGLTEGGIGDTLPEPKQFGGGSGMWRQWILLAALFVFPRVMTAGIATIDFEGFADSTILTNQYPGFTFTNTIILTDGISLNEIDFPPHSGVNVASDNGGPLGITFDTPIFRFAGYFTYVDPLTLDAFDTSNSQVASASSLFSNNTATGGDAGSSPNELLQVSFAGGIKSVLITGNQGGGSFAMDDITLTTTSTAVPEPGNLPVTTIGIGALLLCRRLWTELTR
jgi:hypothetical protein